MKFSERFKERMSKVPKQGLNQLFSSLNTKKIDHLKRLNNALLLQRKNSLPPIKQIKSMHTIASPQQQLNRQALYKKSSFLQNQSTSTGWVSTKSSAYCNKCHIRVRTQLHESLNDSFLDSMMTKHKLLIESIDKKIKSNEKI